ncbi:phospholipid-transporting ATPase [Strigomonas culicis]|nr:phospholipid-transporting ATPase [Strigomonas culicis]|eukprot:EPY22896.1 phospholipid-transporting ATPase [Strigomonas culicis]
MLELDSMTHALSLDQFLYRGCVLRNTDWVWGMVAYAGVDTKMMRNLKEKPPKSSSLDSKLNYLIIVIFVVQNICLMIICSLAVWFNSTHTEHWYLAFFLKQYIRVRLWGYRYLTYFILLGYFIPISLFVTTELCKVIQAQWMRVDCEMMEWMTDKWRHCQPNTSNLNEQLAMVKFIFSDKTGTLTENVMKFKKGNVLGVPIDIDDVEDTFRLLKKRNPLNAAVTEYFLALSICNTIQPFKKDGTEDEFKYEGSSPDEVALVETAAAVGFRLVARTTKSITIELKDSETSELTRKVFKILATLEFTPDRKMMSIIIQDAETKKVTLYNKGADSFVKPQLSTAPDVQAYMEDTDVALTEMSSTGLRTLLICAKDLNEEEFDTWNTRFMDVGKILINRSEEVDRVCLEMEKDMRLVGATAIEDKLQDQVPETLSFFLSAGVIVWMLTGDKRETAVTIAATSTLCDPRNDFVDHIDIGSLDPKCEEAKRKVGEDLFTVMQHVELKGTDQGRRCTFVVDGPALGIAMEHYFDLFLDLSQRVNSAVCCRLTPLQKANVVHMFQKSTGLTALAIGDGANDVSMIQEGKVGVGIMGLEGAQAALAADYAIPRFKHLRRLCAVHGRYSLYRNASCIIVSFYKNILLAVIQVIFSCYTGFSGQTLFDGWLLTFYNVILTSIPPFFMGIFEKDLPEDAILLRPKLYTSLSEGLYFNVPILLVWGFEAVFHAFLLYFVSYPTTLKRDGTVHNITGSMAGTEIFCCMVLLVLTRFALRIRYWQWLQIFGMGLSFFLFVLLVLVYSLIPSLFGATNFYFQIYELMENAKFWFYLIFFVGLVLVIDLSALFFRKEFFPSLRDRAERQYILRGGFM